VGDGAEPGVGIGLGDSRVIGEAWPGCGGADKGCDDEDVEVCTRERRGPFGREPSEKDEVTG